MRFRNRETDLERELRAQRPQPREQFVQMLSGRPSATRTPGRNTAPGYAAPRVAFVTALTVVLVASLGVAGALGHATKSVHSFGTSVYSVVHSPSSSTLSANLVSADPRANRVAGVLPIDWEYLLFAPICINGHIFFVPAFLVAPLLAFDPPFTAAILGPPLHC
jgi:hypothetical protein